MFSKVVLAVTFILDQNSPQKQSKVTTTLSFNVSKSQQSTTTQSLSPQQTQQRNKTTRPPTQQQKSLDRANHSPIRQRAYLSEDTRASRRVVNIADRPRSSSGIHKLPFTSLLKTLQSTKEKFQFELEQRRKIEQEKGALESEVDKLRWYFLPEEEQQISRKDFSDAIVKLEKLRRQERYDEIETIRSARSNRPVVSPREFHKLVQKSLIEMNPETRVEFSTELKNFLEEMSKIESNISLKLILAYHLTEAKVSPKVIRELSNLAIRMTEEQVPVMETPEAIIVFCQRESELEKDFGKRHDLFNKYLEQRVVTLRARRTGRSEEIARHQIFYTT